MRANVTTCLPSAATQPLAARVCKDALCLTVSGDDVYAMLPLQPPALQMCTEDCHSNSSCPCDSVRGRAWTVAMLAWSRRRVGTGRCTHCPGFIEPCRALGVSQVQRTCEWCLAKMSYAMPHRRMTHARRVCGINVESGSEPAGVRH